MVNLLKNNLFCKKFIIDRYFPNNIDQLRNLMPKPGIIDSFEGYFKTHKNEQIEKYAEIILQN